GYRFTAQRLVPLALEDEETEAEALLPGADRIGEPAEVLASVRHRDGSERALIFAMPCGSGLAIYDLMPDEAPDDIPIVWRLADPARRLAELGAMVAVDRACGRDLKQPAAYNLTIDDRPASFDYFTVK